MSKNEAKQNEALIGNVYAIAAYVLWGLLPLYWKMLKNVPAGEILAHRIFWSFIFVTGLVMAQRRWGMMKDIFKNGKLICRIGLCTIFITINWFIYIWAVNSDHIVEASMGYYINPLIVILLGRLVLKEKLNFWQGLSVVLATIGVAIVTIEYGKVPWVALSLAISFALYGLCKKLTHVDSIVGLGIETLLISPLALAYIIVQQLNGNGALGTGTRMTTLFLLGSGVATATPLLWFAQGARRVPLTTMGFYQYIAPTISLILGVFLFKEQFTATHAVSFGLIWAGLMMYMLSKFIRPRKKSVSLSQTVETRS